MSATADSMAPEAAERLAAVLGCRRLFRPGDEVPLLYHWAYFTEAVLSSELGPDGHPVRDDPFAGRLPRRMAASGRVQKLAPLRLGQAAKRSSQLEELVEKQGRSGPLAFARWHHRIEQGGRPVLDEHQTLVYREAARPAGGPSGALALGGAEGSERAMWRRSVSFDAVTLFRYSAVTWNAHRVHYDWQYATGQEGYPGLVVQGPLLASVLAGQAEEALGPLESIEYRAQAPVFAGQQLDIFTLLVGEGQLVAEARAPGGSVAFRLVARGAGGGL